MTGSGRPTASGWSTCLANACSRARSTPRAATSRTPPAAGASGLFGAGPSTSRALACDRDQLWAEAVARYRAGEPWWLETRNLTELAEEEQLDRYQGDAWDDTIRDYLLNEHEWLANGCDGRMLR